MSGRRVESADVPLWDPRLSLRRAARLLTDDLGTGWEVHLVREDPLRWSSRRRLARAGRRGP